MLNSQLNAPLTMNADKGSKNKFPSSFFGCAAYTDKEVMDRLLFLFALEQLLCELTLENMPACPIPFSHC